LRPRPALRSALDHTILILGSAFMLAPVVLIIMSSTQSGDVLSSQGLTFIPGGHAYENYSRALFLKLGFSDRITLAQMLKNSMVVGVATATLTTVLSLLTAYALVFFRLRIAGVLFWLVFVTLLFPLESRFIPTFGVTSALGLTNSYTGLVLPTLALALGTFFFRQFFLTLPDQLIEAAVMDGAGPIRFLLDILAPLTWARAGAIFTIAFMIGWNQYLWPLMISSDESQYTLMRGIRLIGARSTLGMTFIVISLLPPLILLIAFQRWFFAALVETHNHEG
jgi:sn-glycerol 3-phosphate transport system permease protein